MTIILLCVTCLVSILAFNNDQLFFKLQFNPYQVYHRKEYYRLVSHAFIHADWMHLIVNMIVLYSFGTNVEAYFGYYIEKYGSGWFMFMYLAAIVFASVTTLKKHKDNPLYNSVGASGAVSAVLFCSIFFDPWSKINLYFAIPIPAILFGMGYLIYSQYMSKRNMDNINHDAHFIGAIFGFLFPLLIKFDFIHIFLNRLMGH
jgi:membrane associated rhomboid family serine protease